MTDTKAPERIWAWDWPNYTHLGQWSGRDSKGTTVYVRGDLHDATTKQRDELAVEVERLTKERDLLLSAKNNWNVRANDMEARATKAEAERDAALARKAVVIEQTKQALAMGEAGYSVSYNPDAQAALDKLIADARADWQPIETALDDDVRILAFVPRYGVTTAHFDIHNTHRFICHSVLNREAQPTHWMPLPEPPARINETQEGERC